MKNLTEEINRMRNLISAKHGKINFLNESDDKKTEDKKEDENKKSEQLAAKKREEEMAAKKREEEMAAKKREEEMAAKKREEDTPKKIEKQPEEDNDDDDLISLKDEIEKYDDDYDIDVAEELDDLIYDLLPDDEINPIKRKIMELIKSQGNYEKNS